MSRVVVGLYCLPFQSVTERARGQVAGARALPGPKVPTWEDLVGPEIMAEILDSTDEPTEEKQEAA